MVEPIQRGGKIVLNVVEKAGAFQNGKIILNTNPNVDAVKFVRQLIRGGVIRITTPQATVEKNVRQAVLKARQRKLRSIPLTDYTILNKTKLNKQIGVTSANAKNPFTVVKSGPKQSKDIERALAPIRAALKLAFKNTGINQIK
jgi:hypothetical protein